jgi:hypothetical protein
MPLSTKRLRARARAVYHNEGNVLRDLTRSTVILMIGRPTLTIRNSLELHRRWAERAAATLE